MNQPLTPYLAQSMQSSGKQPTMNGYFDQLNGMQNQVDQSLGQSKQMAPLPIQSNPWHDFIASLGRGQKHIGDFIASLL